MQIHHVLSKKVEKWVFDDRAGPEKRVVDVSEKSGLDRIQTGSDITAVPVGTVYELKPDGTFHVPDEVGAWFLKQFPGMHQGLPPWPPEDPSPGPRRGPGRPRKEPADA